MGLKKLTSIEVCAGAGGQAIGLEQAGFKHVALVENDKHACATLRQNRPKWRVDQCDLTEWSWGGGSVDLLAGGVPCPPFSKAGKQLGGDDERDLFPEILRLARENEFRAVMVENVRGLLDDSFLAYREDFLQQLAKLGLVGEWKLLQAADFGVPQLRPRSVLVAMRPDAWNMFVWPVATHSPDQWVSVGDALLPYMAADGWEGASDWAEAARGVAPTLVGGSKKHGGPDLGPTRARSEWMARHHVEGRTIGNAPPVPGHVGPPRITVPMAARLQGFPIEWEIVGAKTNAYKQIGNAFPPPVARAVGGTISRALRASVTD
jgi:DNA (cytosine-5)-methyltransferase 1